MKLDKDLIRAILLEVESWPPTQYEGRALELDGHEAAAVSYHLMVLGEAGYLVVDDVGYTGSDIEFEAVRLTYAGHEYVDAVRNPEIWKQTKAAAGKAGSLSLKVIIEVASALGAQTAKAALGLS
jgi:DNA-binding transcriptional ArsR family regulator